MLFKLLCVRRNYSLYLKRDLINIKVKRQQQLKKIILFLPWFYSVLILKNTQLSLYYIYLSNYYIFVSFLLPKNYIKLTFDEETNSIYYLSLNTNNFTKVYLSTISRIFTSFSKSFFVKLKFKGKGYYIYKNLRNTIAPQFGYSHRIYIYSWYNNVKFTSKSSLILFGLCLEDINKVSLSLQNFRKINVFTGRGVRFARQILYSKPGKVSTYR